MADKLPYATSVQALLNPAHHAVFFSGWDPATDNHNYDLLCAEMSRLAYADASVVEGALSEIGFSAGGFIDLQGTRGFVAKHPDLTVIAFCGTESIEHLLTDLDTLQTDFRNNSRVHAGFLKAYQGLVRDQISSSVRHQQGPLLLTGHSLGAAMATFAALDVQPDELITFGSPRIGDGRFADLFKGLKVHRFVNCCDVVTRIPPERFDQKNLFQLFGELNKVKRFHVLGMALETETAARLTASVLSGAFQEVAPTDSFAHIAPPYYIRADGTVVEHPGEEEILADQDAARAAYQVPVGLGRQMEELFRSLWNTPTGFNPSSLIPSWFDVMRKGAVVLRDLADHAPINYLSALS